MAMNNRLKLFLPVVLFLGAAGLLFFGLFQDPSSVQSALINRPLPDFEQPALYAEEGTYTNEDLKGSITILNVWGSWCPPCHVEHPYLIEISEREEDLQFVGVSYDYSIEEDRAFLAERGTPFEKNIVDMDGSLRIDLGVTGAPETFIIDSKGVIAYRHIGAVDFKVWEETFEPIISLLRSEGR